MANEKVREFKLSLLPVLKKTGERKVLSFVGDVT